MTPDPNASQLDNEISAALDGVNLQEVSAQAEAAPGTGLRKGLMDGVVQGIAGDDVIV